MKTYSYFSSVMNDVVKQLKFLSGFLFIGLMYTACNYNRSTPPDRLKEGYMNTTSFGFDRRFLQQNDNSLVQLQLGDASILVSPRYQGKVFTSTASGDEGKSFGWINYKAFSTPLDAHINAYGGENRFWLGPEGGQFSLFFNPGDSMKFDNWKTPAPFDTETWQQVKKSDRSVTMRKDMRLTNYVGQLLSIRAERTVVMQSNEDVEKTLAIALNDSIRYVGYSTRNSIKNTGEFAWNDSTGMPCIWILDMFNPSPSAIIVIPVKLAPHKNTRVLTTDYFGEIGRSRLKISDSVIFFKADGKKRSKMGVLPPFAKPVAGSYDPLNRLLTITYFSVDSSARYLNQVWNTDNPVYSGDAVNAYNDGPLGDGTQLGPFYELESVSPAAFLSPGESLLHRHDVYHFNGSEKYLDSIAIKILGVNLRTINNSLRN